MHSFHVVLVCSVVVLPVQPKPEVRKTVEIQLEESSDEENPQPPRSRKMAEDSDEVCTLHICSVL